MNLRAVLLAFLMTATASAGDRHPPAAPAPLSGPYASMGDGLQYYDHLIGTGDTAGPGDAVVVEYTGWLQDGTMFDSSLKRPTSFAFDLGAGRVIRGWDLGVTGMRVGGKRQLRIPSELAYGDRDRGPIPAGSTLVFDVELVGIRRVPTQMPSVDVAWRTTPSGLQIHELASGSGKLAKGHTVIAEYSGWLPDGTLFDSSFKRPSGLEVLVGSGRVIKGWDEALSAMHEGDRWLVRIPPDLGYGARGAGGVIPPNATLVFEMQVVEVK